MKNENQELELLLEDFRLTGEKSLLGQIGELLVNSYIIYPTNITVDGEEIDQETIFEYSNDEVQYEISYVTIEGLNFLPVFTSEEKLDGEPIEDKKRCYFPFKLFIENFIKATDMEIEGVIVNPNKDNFILPTCMFDTLIELSEEEGTLPC